jgi:hypothetical protein
MGAKLMSDRELLACIGAWLYGVLGAMNNGRAR